MKDALTIGRFASLCRVSRDTIRFYERVGLLPHARRSASKYRVYTQEDERRLTFIRRAQAIGLTLDQIRGLLRCQEMNTPGECRRVAAVLRERIRAVDVKLHELTAFRRQLAEGLAQCEAADADACPVVLELARPGPRSRKES